MSGGTGPSGEPQGTYSPYFAYVYIFNLIVGVGVLALPLAFSNAGLVLGTILLVVLCCMSYMTSTYMIEAMAAANAYSKLSRSITVSHVQNEDKSLSVKPEENYESTPLIARVTGASITAEESEYSELPSTVFPSESDDYEIVEKFEMGRMANMFYHPVGIVLYYITICLYLFGDLSIYATAIPKSLTVAVCPNSTGEELETHLFNLSNATTNFADFGFDSDGNFTPNVTGTHSNICFKNVTNKQMYYIFLALTVLLLCPWTFFNLTRSKYLQLFTITMRNIAFGLMVIIAIVDLAQGKHASPMPHAASLKGFPVLFGVTIYAFMCQHSLPGMITPMRTKKGVFPLIAVDFGLILLFYLVISYTGAFRFSQLDDLYTLTFFKDLRYGEIVLRIVGYYLALFPVFTLSTNFPIISITLRENLKDLARVMLKRDKPFPFLVDRIVFPLIAITPPIVIAFATENVEVLVSITGSFPGVGVQYIIPATLAFAGRYVIRKKFKEYNNKYRSPFGHNIFFVFVLVWTVISIILIIVDYALKIS